ncbi:integrase [Gossypium australe]|uniref:Integrase n=1 Tax=Gossypium australe TaxID=47621 RepID=A0A5B6VDP4_9ROSI|nr:integrase [Gossypium australe]
MDGLLPRNNELIHKILHEAHSGCLNVHPDSMKMYNGLRESYWCPSMKKDISEYIEMPDLSVSEG